jgi:hypothetical protein
MKLTKEMRTWILDKAINAVFNKRDAAILQAENALAETGYNLLYPLSIRMKMEALPDEFFTQTSTIWVDNDGRKRELKLVSSKKISALDSSWKLPFWADGGARVSVQKHFKKKAKLQGDKEKLTRELKGFLEGVTTSEKLKAAWPDGESYYSFLTDKPTAYPVMVRPDAINEMIMQMGEVE